MPTGTSRGWLDSSKKPSGSNMPFFYFRCPEHGKFRAVLPRRVPTWYCTVCHGTATAVLNVPGSTIMETLDNGAMSRKVTRMHDVEEILDDVAKKYAPKDEEGDE